jgi:hypothetical protein
MMKCKVHVSHSGIEGQNGSYKFTGLEHAKLSILCQTERICNMFYLPQHYFNDKLQMHCLFQDNPA